jgi:hypothetical protein
VFAVGGFSRHAFFQRHADRNGFDASDLHEGSPGSNDTLKCADSVCECGKMESEGNSWGFESAGSALYTSSTENSEADGQFSGVGFARKKTKIHRQAIEGVVVGLTLVHRNAII